MSGPATPSRSPLFYHAMAMGTICIWSFSYLFIILLGRELDHMSVAVSRKLVFVAFVLGLLIWKRPPMRSLSLRQWGMLALLGLVGGPLYHVIFAWASGQNDAGEDRIDPGLLGLIIATVPVYTSVLAWIFLREHLNWQTMLAVMLGLVGVGIVMTGRHGPLDLLPRESLEGPVAATAAAMVGGGIIVLTRACRSIFGAHEIVGVSGIFIVLYSACLIPWADLGALKNLTATGVIALLYLGICGSGLAFLLWAAALQGLPATVVAMYLFLASVLSSLWGWIFLNKPVGWEFIPGAGLVLVGLLLVAKAQSAPRPDAANKATN